MKIHHFFVQKAASAEGCSKQHASRRRLPALFLLVLLASLLLTGCSRETQAEKAAKSCHWPLATASPEDTVTQLYAERFAEEVHERSGGRITVTVYPNSSLGGDRELLESCADADIPFIIQNTAPQVAFMEDLAVFDLPCVFTDTDELYARIDNKSFMHELDQVYTDGGYRLLGIADQGFRVMTTDKRITSLEDFRGQKIRTMENPYHLDFWKAIGASPLPMSFSEVYIGLQQHTIDAQENPYEVIVSNRLYEQQDYVIETNHLPHLLTLITSEDFMDALSEEDRSVVLAAAEAATAYAREASLSRIEERKAIIEESGTEILTLSPELRSEMIAASEDVYEEIKASVSPALYRAYTSSAN